MADMQTTATTEEATTPARFLNYENHGKKWHTGRLVRVVTPALNRSEPYCELIEDRTGAIRTRPVKVVEVEVVGPRGGRSWWPVAHTELVTETGKPLDARPPLAEEPEA